MLAIPLILVRFAAMVLCAFVFTVAALEALDRALPFATSFDQVFNRLERAMVIGEPAGVVWGALMVHPLGHGRYDFDIRLGFAVTAAIPFLLQAVVALFSR